MRTHLLALASFACLPLVGLAQTDPASAHFYVGAGASLLTNVPFNSAGVPRLVGPSLTAGMQLAPRLALQASASYYWQSTAYSYPSYYYYGQGALSAYSYSSRQKTFMVPVLLRYTFTSPVQRFHFDGLAGITVVHSTFHEEYTISNSGTSYSDARNSGITRASITLGPAARYAIAPNVELTANALVSAVVGDTYYYFSDRLYLNVLVGAHYTFGQH